MATKVKPCRIKATGTPQVGYVPKYVDEDTFQWGAGGGGGGSEIEYVTQAEYNALLPGAESDGKHYFIYTGITPPTPLPAEYQEVEYIENSGTQYIKTELDIKDGYRLVQKLRFLTSVSSLNNLAGGYLGNSGSTYYRLYLFGLQSNQLNIGYLNYEQSGISATIGTDYVIDYSWISGNMHLIIDGNTISAQSGTYSINLAGKVCVMGGYRQDANPKYGANAGMRLYEAQIYDSGGTKVRDLVPCYRIADSVIGLYDLENDTFYTNDGTGTFTKGPDVN